MANIGDGCRSRREWQAQNRPGVLHDGWLLSDEIDMQKRIRRGRRPRNPTGIIGGIAHGREDRGTRTTARGSRSGRRDARCCGTYVNCLGIGIITSADMYWFTDQQLLRAVGGWHAVHRWCSCPDCHGVPPGGELWQRCGAGARYSDGSRRGSQAAVEYVEVGHPFYRTRLAERSSRRRSRPQCGIRSLPALTASCTSITRSAARVRRSTPCVIPVMPRRGLRSPRSTPRSPRWPRS